MNEHCRDALLVTEYEDSFRESGSEGIWRFNWLPVRRPGVAVSGPVVYRSRGLGPRLGLSNLYIAFNGYRPEIGARIPTCTFKEFEAAMVLQNAKESGCEGLVVASAGNTARAFAHLSARTGFPVIIVVPLMCIRDMWYLESSAGVPTVIIRDGDYADAIDLARRISRTVGLPFEGGAKNVAKRDGLGVVLLESVSAIGNLPDHYIQAVGSGTGAIAAWEMSERFLKDGRFGEKLPRLHLAQNLPFAPMLRAWSRGERALSPEDLTPDLVREVATRVLSNRYPAYSIQGGVFDALQTTRGSMHGVTNREISEAERLFEGAEGIDIVPAAAVAVAALVHAVQDQEISPEEVVLLNISGGGEKGIRKEGRAHPVSGKTVSKEISEKEIEELLCVARKKISLTS